MARKGAMGGVGGGGGGGGLDFSMLFSNTVLLGTLGLAALAWIIAFIGQIAAEANNARQQTLWFNIFLQLFLMIGIALAIMSNNIAVHRLQICMFLAVALVFSVIGINQGIYSNVASQNAVTAGWFILTIINIIWLLFFSADEDSLIYGMLSGFGNGSLGGPGGRASRGGGAGISRMGGGNMNNGNGYGGGFGSGQGMNGGYQPTYGQGPSAADVTMSAPKSNGMIGGPGSIRSAHTHHTAAGAGGAVGASSSKPEFGQAGDLGRAASPTSTNKHSAVGTTEAAGEPSAGYGYRARALYAYTANADDPTEISFSKGEILDIVDNSGKWWQARKPNGETGIVPSNYMQVL